MTIPPKETAIPEDLGTLYGELSGGARTSCSRSTALGLIERLGRAETALREIKSKLIHEHDKAAVIYPRLVVCAIIVRDGKVLLEKRAPSGIEGLDGMWDLPGGKVECAETPQKAVVREIREEMLVDIECDTVLAEAIPSRWAYKDRIRHWLLVGCICRILAGEPVLSEYLQWFALDELPKELLQADWLLIKLARAYFDKVKA
jgi:8-oxo-dGTP diphosphatase